MRNKDKNKNKIKTREYNKMGQDLKCFIGLHRYEVIDTKELKNPYGITVGTVIISRCTNCGKIKEKPIYTDNNYRIR